MKKRIAIFASGEGTNAKAIIDYFRSSQHVEVALVVSDNPNSKVLDIATSENISSVLITKEDLNDERFMSGMLKEYNLDLIVLAGFMKIVPEFLVKEYRNKILNIHPAIDKKYDGKTGKAIPNEVIANKDKTHGSRVHIVTEQVDGGEVLGSETFSVDKNWNAKDITNALKQIEHKLYPRVIENYLKIK
jgi:phosphoribosylglycinamide formyltransferase-1